MIMRTVLVVAGGKLCSIFFRKRWFRETIVIIINETFDQMRAILPVKYFENELHNVSNEDCSGSVLISADVELCLRISTSGEGFQNLLT